MYNIGVYGANGRVGQYVIEVISNDAKSNLSYSFSRDGNNDITALCQSSDIIIDFTLPAATPILLDTAIKHNTAIVSGVTGYTPAEYKLLAKTAQYIPILHAANMSIGINLLNNLLAQTTDILGDDFDITISELHHRHKRDKPSATALALIESMHNKAEIASLRAGGSFCEHEIKFLSQEEEIGLQHRILSRKVFAEGALKAAKWLHNKPAGLYNMQNIFDN